MGKLCVHTIEDKHHQTHTHSHTQGIRQGRELPLAWLPSSGFLFCISLNQIRQANLLGRATYTTTRLVRVSPFVGQVRPTVALKCASPINANGKLKSRFDDRATASRALRVNHYERTYEIHFFLSRRVKLKARVISGADNREHERTPADFLASASGGVDFFFHRLAHVSDARR